MAGNRSRYGLLVSALGAIVLAVSVFLPWYGMSVTAHHQLTAVSAHQALRDLNIVLLVLAGLAMLDALFPLARSVSSVPDGAGASVVLLGTVATVCVLYRMVDPPTPPGDLVALSLREGAWLALLGSLTMVLGGLWPRRVPSPAASDVRAHTAWSGLSGSTPGG
jgi:hypothetical protein